MKKNDRQGKYERIELVRNLIMTCDISDQQQLMRELRNNGANITQPTLSRYLRKLKAVKELGMDGRSHYKLPQNMPYHRVAEPALKVEKGTPMGFVSIRYSGNMGVIKTLPGHAPALAYLIDNSNPPFILGTIAGDDTIFIVRNSEATNNDITSVLKGIIPDMD